MDKVVQMKISGYLEKKSKKKMISTYKKYWFVLEGRLLLYYRSKDEYDAISPCKGSINLGPPCAVKPCPSNNGLFQIETRYNTITLRCLDHDDQKRWMQAIMAALNQNQSIAKLSHFRYSLDSGINQNVDDQINGKSTPKRRNSLINRLQKLGGQSYGGSLGQISRIATSFGVTKTKSTETTFENQSKCQSAYFNNEHYSVIKSSSSGSVEFRKLVTNNQSEQEHLYEIVDKECTYSVPNKKSSPSQTRTTFIIDNEHYCGVDQTITFPNTDSEVIYTEPTCTGKIDHNDNTLIIDNPTYTTINRMVDNDEIVKSSSPSPTNSIIIENTDYMQINRNNNLYEDVDNFEISDNSSQTSDDKPKKRFQSFRRKFGFKDKMNTEQNKSIKKSQSFIKRVWKRKKDKKVQEDDIYETIQDDKVKKIELGDDETVQMLSELQNLLETKKPMLLQKMYEEPKSPEIPPKTTKKTHSPPPEKTIDEILDDLEQESGKTKVKTLIKKFSGDFHVNDDEEVTLRKSTRETNRENRFSDELTQLLDELTKVTSAPLMTPGVTMSLINPNLTDEELLQMIPIRKRRFSEPDYDVPRPHRITKDGDTSITCMQFFGPSEKTNFFGEEFNITPDSLEPHIQLSKIRLIPKSHCSINKETQYNSDTMQNNEKNRCCDEYTVYTQPKSINYNKPVIFKTLEEKRDDKDLFIDSLEIGTEVSTAF